MFFAYNTVYKITDKGILELIGPFGFFKILQEIATKINTLQNGEISQYLKFMAIIPLLFVYFLTEDFFNITLNLQFTILFFSKEF